MKHIVIAGGYGHVGQKIARRLAHTGAVRVTIAGRDADKAQRAASRLGVGWARLDVTAPEARPDPLAAADIVICCLDTPTDALARATLARGAAYVDITATDAVIRRIEALDGLAREHGTLAVLSVGLAPGLTNLLARQAVEAISQADAVRIGILLGLGDAHGPAALDWSLRSFASVDPGDISPMRFQPGGRPLPTVPFDFSDQHTLMRRGYRAVETRLALGSPLVTPWTLGLLSRLSRNAGVRRALVRLLGLLRIGDDRAALLVEASGQIGEGPARCSIALDGRREADITAMMAAEVALRLDTAGAQGVRHIDELWRLGEFEEALSAEGIALHTELASTGSKD
ncbi:hypothetical protein AWJ14_03655 [Hoeflea olei]|uniref:Saccharopine dehydrogenase NADP binding domain-containing protein n=2 Tax=Hoeflea olei TaxID=1480615 RepID=A0A1C1YWN6_9HYPH|nr:hypothetical protein AWJ14_03655 [Hoeflea olei]